MLDTPTSQEEIGDLYPETAIGAAFVREADEYCEEDSLSKEHRIRRAADFDPRDLADEGNKSTYLRPSKDNRSTADILKSQYIDTHSKLSKQ